MRVGCEAYKLVHYSHGRWTDLSLPTITNRAGHLLGPLSVGVFARIPGSSIWVTIDIWVATQPLRRHERIFSYQP